jgi:ribosomal protein S27AE
MTDAFTEHKPRCPKCRANAIVDRENRVCCPRCGYVALFKDWKIDIQKY